MAIAATQAESPAAAYDPVPARDAARLELAIGNLREHQIRGKAHAEEGRPALRLTSRPRPWPRPGQGLVTCPGDPRAVPAT